MVIKIVFKFNGQLLQKIRFGLEFLIAIARKAIIALIPIDA